MSVFLDTFVRTIQSTVNNPINSASNSRITKWLHNVFSSKIFPFVSLNPVETYHFSRNTRRHILGRMQLSCHTEWGHVSFARCSIFWFSLAWFNRRKLDKHAVWKASLELWSMQRNMTIFEYLLTRDQSWCEFSIWKKSAQNIRIMNSSILCEISNT